MVLGRRDDGHQLRPSFGRLANLDHLHPIRFLVELLPILDKLRVGGKLVVVADVEAVARGDREVALAPEAVQRMLRAQAFVDRIVRDREVVYGVTTGFGKLSEVAIPPERLGELQVNLVRSHASGVGDAFSAGQDIGEMARIDPGSGEATEHGFTSLFDTLSTFEKPLVVAVNGVGVGIGMTMKVSS